MPARDIAPMNSLKISFFQTSSLVSLSTSISKDYFLNHPVKIASFLI